MKTVLMAIAVVKKDNKILIRKMDPARNPYQEPWGLFGGRLEGEGTITEQMNRELRTRWNMTVAIAERLWWDEDQKLDHDNVEKKFIYLDVLCDLVDGEPVPINPSEELKWVAVNELKDYRHNPPSTILLKKLGYL